MESELPNVIDTSWSLVDGIHEAFQTSLLYLDRDRWNCPRYTDTAEYGFLSNARCLRKYTYKHADLTSLPALPNLPDLDILSLPYDQNTTIFHRKSFVVENCEGNADWMQYIISAALDAIAPALNDVRKGNESQHGFEAMFKGNEAVPTIRKLLQYMYLFTGLPGLRPTPARLSQPRFACVDGAATTAFANLHLGYDPAARCSTKSGSMLIERSFYAEQTSYIFICTAFFFLRPKPDVLSKCPVVKQNKFTGSQVFFHQRYQVYRIVYDLVRFYLGNNALDSDSDPREVFNWNACVSDLNLLESVINPTNLEIYVAREFPTSSNQRRSTY